MNIYLGSLFGAATGLILLLLGAARLRFKDDIGVAYMVIGVAGWVCNYLVLVNKVDGFVVLGSWIAPITIFVITLVQTKPRWQLIAEIALGFASLAGALQATDLVYPSLDADLAIVASWIVAAAASTLLLPEKIRNS